MSSSENIEGFHVSLSADTARFTSSMKGASAAVARTGREMRGAAAGAVPLTQNLGKTIGVVANVAQQFDLAGGAAGKLLGAVTSLAITGFSPLGIAIAGVGLVMGALASTKTSALNSAFAATEDRTKSLTAELAKMRIEVGLLEAGKPAKPGDVEIAGAAAALEAIRNDELMGDDSLRARATAGARDLGSFMLNDWLKLLEMPTIDSAAEASARVIETQEKGLELLKQKLGTQARITELTEAEAAAVKATSAELAAAIGERPPKPYAFTNAVGLGDVIGELTAADQPTHTESAFAAFMAAAPSASAGFGGPNFGGELNQKDSSDAIAAMAARRATLDAEVSAVQALIPLRSQLAEITTGASAQLLALEEQILVAERELETLRAGGIEVTKEELEAKAQDLAGLKTELSIEQQLDRLRQGQLARDIAQVNRKISDPATGFFGGFFAGAERATLTMETLGEAGASVYQDLAQGFGTVFATAILDAENLSDVLGNVLRQMASAGLTQAGSQLAGVAVNAVGAIANNLLFADGGSFTVGGAGGVDSSLIAFKATPGERVDVTKRVDSARGAGGGNVFVTVHNNAEATVATRSSRSSRGTELVVAVEAIVEGSMANGRIGRALEARGLPRQGRRG